jgi:hypothetical protein
MSYTIEITNGYIMVSFERGTLFNPDLIIDALNLERNSQERLTMSDIWDVRGGEVGEGLNSESVELIVQHIKTLHAGKYHKRSALVIDSKVALGMARMFQILSAELPYETQAFEDLHEAKNWVLGHTPS